VGRIGRLTIRRKSVTRTLIVRVIVIETAASEWPMPVIGIGSRSVAQTGCLKGVDNLDDRLPMRQVRSLTLKISTTSEPTASMAPRQR
jgi:hypothetical protein